MGSAIAAHCAARGASVIGLEQFGPAHDRGASHGKSRMIRQAYFEDPAYVPLVLRSYELWRALERRNGRGICCRSPASSRSARRRARSFRARNASAEEHGLRMEKWSREQVRERYPALRLLPTRSRYSSPTAACSIPKAAVRAHLSAAQSAGAELRFETASANLGSDRSRRDHSISPTVRGSRPRKLILSLGPWFKETLAGLGIALQVQRNVQVWFSPATNHYQAGRFPAFLLDRAGLPAPLYGFPDFGDGRESRVSRRRQISPTADELDREVDIGSRCRRPSFAPWRNGCRAAAAVFREAKPCMYSLTPDTNFVIDRHPAHANVILCGGFSGHGFKFAPVIGEIAADLALDGGSRHRIDFLSLKRFV